MNLTKLIRKNILELKPYSSARDEFQENDVVLLDANENPYGSYNRYPDPYQTKLKKRISKLKKVASKNIFIGNGSDEIIDLAIRIFCNPYKDMALTFSPTYGMYQVSAKINGVKIILLPLNHQFQIEIIKVKQYLTDEKLKLIFICSPNNPTGNSIDKKAIEYILKNFKGIVLLDEAYIDFSKEQSWISKLDLYPNLIVLQTLSKAWGLAATRIGIAYASENIISYFNKIKPPYNVSQLNQSISLNVLENVERYQRHKKLIISEKKRMIQELSYHNDVLKIYPSQTNFILIQVQDADFIYKNLLKQKVIVRNRNSQVNNCIRITIGTKEENNKVLQAFQNL